MRKVQSVSGRGYCGIAADCEGNGREASGKGSIENGEIYPTNTAPILMGLSLSPEPAAWGFPGFKGSGAVINARAETAAEKRMFAESLVARRCVIPSTGFYEWKKEGREKRKYLFRIPEKKLLYMAGLYKEFQGERRYVILTTEPNSSIADVHNRMPVVLPEDMLATWVMDGDMAEQILKGVPPLLSRQAG